jgi:hypothetical protein
MDVDKLARARREEPPKKVHPAALEEVQGMLFVMKSAYHCIARRREADTGEEPLDELGVQMWLEESRVVLDELGEYLFPDDGGWLAFYEHLQQWRALRECLPKDIADGQRDGLRQKLENLLK